MTATLIRNAHVFDGTSPDLSDATSVLVDGGKILEIGSSVVAPDDALVIDAGGRTLMPGLIDAHWHSMLNFWPISKVFNADFGLLSIYAAHYAGDVLRRGFTTVRDIGGNCFGVKHAIDAGLVDGPRIYPSGGMLSQTSGHMDFRGPNDVPAQDGAPLDYMERVGHLLLADGVPEVIKRTREVLRMGATQIKAMAGGGVTTLYDPLDVAEYTLAELSAIVEVAKTWNTYVAIHVNTDAAIQTALDAGVQSIEHGFFITDDTAKRMADEGAWWSMQPFMLDEDAPTFESDFVTAKYESCVVGLDAVVGYTKKYGVKTAFGTDSLFDPETSEKQGKLLAKLKQWYTPFEALKMATSDNAELLKLCGPRDPYVGDLGVIREGAWADLLVVDGNPLENLDLVADPTNFVVIMKDGKVYENRLTTGS